MLIGCIEGATRILGRRQGYNGLPLRDDVMHCAVNGPATPCMTSAWGPTPDEIARLAAGAPVYLRVLGSEHPPVMLEVGEPPK